MIEGEYPTRKVTLDSRELIEAIMPCAEPGCTGIMSLRDSRYGLFYGCQFYPKCECTHGAHPDGTPLGRPATKETKKARIEAHAWFDKLWKRPEGKMDRSSAYRWMIEAMGLTSDTAHIGRFTTEDCQNLTAKVQAYLESPEWKQLYSRGPKVEVNLRVEKPNA